MKHCFYYLYLLLLVTSHVKASNFIEQLTLMDSALMSCIKAQAELNNWKKIDQIHTVKCHGMKIKCTKGLASFVNLKSLSLYNNKLTDIDLHNLVKLEYVNVANNQLKTINLSALTNLETLYLFKNKLVNIDFTDLVQLKKIRITNNRLTSLDISPLISLEKAYFFNNKLNDLIVKGLPKLKFIELRQNPMTDEVYERYDELEGITIIHDGNADDWK